MYSTNSMNHNTTFTASSLCPDKFWFFPQTTRITNPVQTISLGACTHVFICSFPTNVTHVQFTIFQYKNMHTSLCMSTFAHVSIEISGYAILTETRILWHSFWLFCHGVMFVIDSSCMILSKIRDTVIMINKLKYRESMTSADHKLYYCSCSGGEAKSNFSEFRQLFKATLSIQSTHEKTGCWEMKTHLHTDDQKHGNCLHHVNRILSRC